MIKSQNRNMGNKRRQGNMTPQKVNSHTIEDLVDSEGNESAVADIRKITRMSKELKDDLQKQLNESQKKKGQKKLEKTQEQLSELKEDFNKH
jgi:hypothetical protein